MSDQQNPRRNFVRNAGVAVASAAFIALPKNVAAQKADAQPKSATHDVKAFGAKGDGKTIDTPAINAAIEAAAKAGGAVYFPAGNYLCYSIHLKSNVTLQLSQGATIVAADSRAADTSDGGKNGYDPAESNKPWEDYQDYGHNHWHNSLIWGEEPARHRHPGPGADLGQRL